MLQGHNAASWQLLSQIGHLSCTAAVALALALPGAAALSERVSVGVSEWGGGWVSVRVSE